MILSVALLPLCYGYAGVFRFSHDLRILAGTELQDVLGNSDVIDGLERATGIRLVPTYTGTLQGVQQAVDSLQAPSDPGSFGAAWFSSPAYLQLVTGEPGAPKLPRQPLQPIMTSPVVLGVRSSVAQALGWAPGSHITWADIAREAGAGKLSFASTDAAASNSGFSALVSVASAFDTSPGTPLATEDIDTQAVQAFFRGRTIKDESSRPLTDAFCRSGRADALINYESEVLSAASRTDCGEHLQLVYPDKSVYADYPLVQLTEGARADVDHVRQWLLSPAGQTALAKAAPRRPVNPEAARSASIPNEEPEPIPIPSELETVRELVGEYLDIFQLPTRTIYLLDVSQSMMGDRSNELQNAVCSLVGNDPRIASQFTRFRANERVTVIPFAASVLPPVEFTASPTAPSFAPVCDYVRSLPLSPSGGTAVYSAVKSAYDLLATQGAQYEGYCQSIVLMTDGESNAGITPDALGALTRPIFTIRFGDASADQLRAIATASGGRYFDTTEQSLRDVFEQTRSIGC